jgi:peptide/nickel transport system substrate-binding protein
MLRHIWVWLVVGTVVALVGGKATAQNQPEGQLTIAFDTSIAPTYLDPAETTGIAAPFVFLYALHDALLKPLPGNLLAPSGSRPWSATAPSANRCCISSSG